MQPEVGKMSNSNEATEFEIGYEEQAILEDDGEIVIKSPHAAIFNKGDYVTIQVTNKRSATSRRRFLPRITTIVVDKTEERIVLSLKQS